MTALAFGFTKLVVRDVDASVDFYRGVFNMLPLHRLTSDEHEYALDEVILSLGGTSDGHRLAITRYLRRPCPPAGAAWTGFVVPDLAKTLADIEKAGGRIDVPMHANKQHGVLVALAADPDGHMIEVVQFITAR